MNDRANTFDCQQTLANGTYWMPFTANRRVRANPAGRIIPSAAGPYYHTHGLLHTSPSPRD